jgi:predicted cupin superfamily sugar epimerase
MHPRAAELIARLRLQGHPEGGYYREIWRSAASVQPADERPARSALTTIYFLLVAGQHSRWHRVRSDEVWHFYEGDPLELLVAPPSVESTATIRLASLDADNGVPVYTVPANWWQGARTTRDFTLVGCTVGPGFDFADFGYLSEQRQEALRLRALDPGAAGLL